MRIFVIFLYFIKLNEYKKQTVTAIYENKISCLRNFLTFLIVLPDNPGTALGCTKEAVENLVNAVNQYRANSKTGIQM